MSELTLTLLYMSNKLFKDDTGLQMVEAIKSVANAIRGVELEKKEWSITINQASSAMAISAMGGDVTSWQIYKSKIGRYLVEFPDENGVSYAHKLNRENSHFMEDETSVDESKGNVMVHFPRLYYKVTTSGDLVTLTMCEREFGENCEEIDDQWVGAYLGSLDSDGRLRSISGKTPTASKSITTFWSDAQKNGANYGLCDYQQHILFVMLYLCEYLDKNSQACLGNGMTGVGNNWCAPVYNAHTGDTATLGDSCGKVMFTASGQLVAGACHVSLFGVEDPYGWFWEMVQGCYFGNSDNEEQTGTECFIYEGNRMPTSDELTTQPSGVYRQLTRVTSSGWLQTIIGGTKFDVLPASVGASRWSDYHYANNTGQLLLWGGSARHGSLGGLVYSYSDSGFSDADSGVSARLAHYNNSMIQIVHKGVGE